MIPWIVFAGWMAAGAATSSAPAEPARAGATAPASSKSAGPGSGKPGAAAPDSGGAASPKGGTGESGSVAPAPAPAEPAPPPAAGAPTEAGAAPPAPGASPEGAATGPGAPGTAAPTEGTPGEAAGTDPEAPAEPAPLPAEGPPAPKPSEPRAWGGAFEAPLPQPPSAADPSTRVTTPWRGRFWLGVGLAGSFPVGGRPPAAGGVISVSGELDVGWRVNRFLGLHTAVSGFAHDAAQQTFTAADGSPVSEVQLGRITAFDLVTARVFLPVHRRIDPWLEAGAGVGARRAPFGMQREAVGLVRAGVGVDFWLAPTLTLGVSTLYRTIILGDTVGHGLRAGLDVGIHW